MALQLPDRAVSGYDILLFEELKKKSIPAIQFTSDPLSLTPEYFNTKGTEMTLAESKKAYSALMNYGLLWPGSSILLKDPSLNRYTEEYIECIAAAVPRVVPRLDSMRSTDSSIMQLLKIAWGLKEFT
eukprot:gene36505-49180_t